MKAEWQPIYSVERSGVPELTIAGLVCVVEGDGESSAYPRLTLGDMSMRLWPRSLLKPWQLLSHLPELYRSYPALEPEHVALMMASHSAEPKHLELLHQIMEIGQAREEWLKCPPALPQHANTRARMKLEGVEPRRLYHNCSGKHFGYLMAIKAAGGDVDSYLNFAGEQHLPLKEMLGYLLGRQDELPVTTDGCQLPNYGLTVLEMATLYQGLANRTNSHPGKDEISERLALYPQLRSLMAAYPQVIGGSERLDSTIMSGDWHLNGNPMLIAKEGADGLLAIGVGACEKYPHGLGILIKVSTGFEKAQMALIAKEIFAQLGLCQHPSTTPAHPLGTGGDHIRINFHFSVEPGKTKRATTVVPLGNVLPVVAVN
ncbi:MAG TPA: asparaginase [Planktothrix sp.]